MSLWATVSGNLKLKTVPCAVVWRHCLDMFESLGNELSSAETDVLAEAVGYNDDASMDASMFALIWERLEPIVDLFRNEQIQYLWRKQQCSLLCDRTAATTALSEPGHKLCVVLRISNTFAGKLTVSSLNSSKKVVHQLVTLDAFAVILGKGVDCKPFEGLNDLFEHLASIGFTHLLGRDNKKYDLKSLAQELPKPKPLVESGDAYTLLISKPSLEASTN